MAQVHAFFDFDDTLLRGDSILYWLRYYYRHRPLRRCFQVVNWAGLFLYLIRLIDTHTLKRIFLMPMAYEDPAALDRLAEGFVREDLSRRFHAPVLSRLWNHHFLGHRVVIISASGTFYLRHLKALLPMAEILGTEMLWPRGIWRLPHYRDGNLKGENKIARLKALGFAGAGPLGFAYSDSHHDAFLLRFVEFPICVRPGSGLKRLAREQGWPVFDWARESPAWMEKLSKLALLLFAVGPSGGGAAADPARAEPAARGESEAHCRDLRERVLLHYSESGDAEVFRRIFGERR